MDFILLWNVGDVSITPAGHDHVFEVTYSAKHPELLSYDLKQLLFRGVRDIVQRIRGSLILSSVTIDGVMPHRKSPGIYMHVSWTCFQGSHTRRFYRSNARNCPT